MTGDFRRRKCASVSLCFQPAMNIWKEPKKNGRKGETGHAMKKAQKEKKSALVVSRPTSNTLCQGVRAMQISCGYLVGTMYQRNLLALQLASEICFRHDSVKFSL